MPIDVTIEELYCHMHILDVDGDQVLVQGAGGLQRLHGGGGAGRGEAELRGQGRAGGERGGGAAGAPRQEARLPLVPGPHHLRLRGRRRAGGQC